MSFRIHTPDTAPAGSRDALAQIKANYGFLPNLAAVVAESPGALNALLGAIKAFDAPELSLSPLERQVVLVAASMQNRCAYCAAGHSMLAFKHGLDREQIENLQDGRPMADPRLEALRRFTEALVEQRGRVADADLEAFSAAGFTKAQVLEVIAGVALKTFTNYTNHVTKPAINEQFAAFAPRSLVMA